MAGINISWDKIFAQAVSTGVKKLGDVAETTDANIKAESKASAEAFAEANEQYTNEVQDNKKALSKEVDSISDLVGGDVGKIRTIMRTYGNADVVSQLQKDFEKYQTSATFEKARTGKEIKFTSLKDYINGKLTKTGTALVSDKAAEQASDETAIAGNELDIQQAEKKAKDMGVSLEQYLNTQARKLSSRPAFSIEGKAARLVEESKVGAFGKTLTMEEARKMVTGGQKLGGTEDETDLGDTGFALEREGGIGARELATILSEANQSNIETGVVNTEAELRPLRNDIIANLPDKLTTLIGDGSNNKKIKNINSDSVSAIVAAIDKKLKVSKDKKTIGMLNQLRKEYLGKLDKPKKKPMELEKAIEKLRKNPTSEAIKFFEETYGKENLPSNLTKSDANKKENVVKENVVKINAVTNTAPDKRTLSKSEQLEWDKKYGKTHYPNGRPKPQSQIDYEQRVRS